MEMIIKRMLALPRRRLLPIMTSIIVTLIFIIEVLATFLRVLLPPLPAMGELLLNALFLSIATILTLYLLLFRSWTRAITKREPIRSSMRKRIAIPIQSWVSTILHT